MPQASLAPTRVRPPARRPATPVFDLAPRLFEGPARSPRPPRRVRPPRAPGPAARLAAGFDRLPRGAKVALALATIYLVWGSTFLSTSVVVRAVPPFLMLASRFLVAGAVLFAFGAWRARRAGTWSTPTWRQWRDATTTGCLLLVGGTGLISLAQVHLSSGLAALLSATVPLWLALIARVRFGDALSWRAWLGLLIGLAGVATLVEPGGGQAGAMLLVLVGAILWALGTLRSRTASAHPAPLVAAAMEMLGAGVGFVVGGLAMGERLGPSLTAIDGSVWGAYVYLVTAGSIVAFTVYRWLMDNVSTTLIGSHGYVNPAVAVVFGWALAGEEITGRTLLGGTVVLVSVVLLVVGRPEQPVPAQVTSGGDVFAGQPRWRRAVRTVGRLPAAARLYVAPGASGIRPARRDLYRDGSPQAAHPAGTARSGDRWDQAPPGSAP